MASTREFYQLADRLLDGQLGERLLALRYDEKLSFRAIAVRLHDEHDINVTDETVRRWIRDVESASLAKAAGE